MKIKHISIVLLILLILASCSANDNTLDELISLEVEHNIQPDVKTPQGLAVRSSQLYMGMVNGTLNINDSIEELLQYTSRASAKQLKESLDAFKAEIKSTKRYLVSIDDEVIGYQYAKAEFTNQGGAYIKRIQMHENGKKYYFEQKFVQENGEWKIASDNLIDPFALDEVVD